MADMYNTPDDDVFTSFVQSKKKAEAEAAAKRGKGFSDKEFEQVKYCAAEKGGHITVRFVGNPPREDGLNVRPVDAIERHISKIKDDNGDTMYLILPCRKDTLAEDHIMWRIVSDVMKKDYVNKKPIFVNQVSHPEIFEIVSKGGFKPEDGFSYTYADSWNAARKLLINCIDRTDDWCKENKHTKVFSKNISIGKKGGEFPDWGVKSNGFLTKLTENLGKYGSWEKYDSYIIRIGAKDEPFRILNGSGYKAANMTAELVGISPDELEKISLSPSLTEEEKAYERYNLEENFRISSYQKLLKRLGNSIKKIDAALGTHYYDELVTLAAKEKKENEIANEAKKQIEAQQAAQQATVTQTVETAEPSQQAAASFDTMAPVTSDPVAMTPPPVSEPVVTRNIAPANPASTALAAEKIAALKGWSTLIPAEQAQIKDVILNADGSVQSIVYDPSSAACLPCPTDQQGCGAMSPSTFTHCPCCGKRFG